MFKTLKQFFDFCNKEDRNKLYLAIALGVIKAIFAALRMPAIAVVVQGLIEGQLTMKHLWLSLGIMVVSVLFQMMIFPDFQPEIFILKYYSIAFFAFP